MSKRGRSPNSFNRRAPTRTAEERLIIVCEGAKTEPRYLEDLITDLGLTAADVIVFGKECGSDPLSIVQYAADRASHEEVVDFVFCVFDRDSHTTREAALSKIRDLSKRSKGPKFVAVESNPCFEYWLLLHFRSSSRPYAKSGKNSVCDCCIEELKEYVKDYEKGKTGLYSALKENLKTALKHADRRNIEAIEVGDDNPTTNIPQLIRKLISISPRRSDPIFEAAT